MNVSDWGIHTRCGMDDGFKKESRDGASITRGSFLFHQTEGERWSVQMVMAMGNGGFGEVAT